MTEKKALILLTGLPGAGKDTLANIFKDLKNVPHVKLADPLVDCMCTLFNVEEEYIKEINDNRSLKELPNPLFGNKSYRECMIWLAEECIKPKFGKNFFISNLINRIESMRYKNVVCVSDLGFKHDELAFIDSNKYKVYIIKIIRDSIDKTVKDSREDIDCNIYETVENNETVKHLKDKARVIISKIYDDIWNENHPKKESK